MKTSLKIVKFLFAILLIGVGFAFLNLDPLLGFAGIMASAPLLFANIETSDDAKVKRSEIRDQLHAMVDILRNEKRSFTDEEQKKHDKLAADYKLIDDHVKLLEDDEKRALIMAGNQAKITNEQRRNQEIGKYSFKRMLELKIDNKPLDGLELEMHQEAVQEARSSQIALSGVGVPAIVIDAIAKRAMTATQQTAAAGDQGGMLIPTEKSGLLFALRPMLTLNQLGANFMGNLVGNLDFVKGTSTVAGWNTEIGTAAETNVATSKVSLSPKRLAAFTEIYKQLMVQTPENVEQKVLGDLYQAIAQAVELAAINGSGQNNQPTGILNTSGIGSVVGGAQGLAPTWNHIVDLENKVDVANALVGRLAYLTNAKVKGKLKTTKLDDGSGLFVWSQNATELNGYPVGVSNLVPSTLTKDTSIGICSAILFGDWSQLMIGQWGGLDMIIDPYSGAKNNKIVITTNSFWDVATVYPEKFAAMLDALA